MEKILKGRKDFLHVIQTDGVSVRLHYGNRVSIVVNFIMKF
jgi:hypothetical protein